MEFNDVVAYVYEREEVWIILYVGGNIIYDGEFNPEIVSQDENGIGLFDFNHNNFTIPANPKDVWINEEEWLNLKYDGYLISIK